MERRQLLATVSSIGMAAVAGCGMAGASKTLSNPTKEVEDDGETHLQFNTEGSRVATLTIQPGRQRYSGLAGEQTTLDVSCSHRDGTKITGLRLELRTLPGGGRPPAEVSLTTPFGTPHPAFQLYSDPQDGGTILDIPDTGEIGDGTLPLEFLLSHLEESTSELEVDATIELTEKGMTGSDYTLEALILIQLPDSNTR